MDFNQLPYKKRNQYLLWGTLVFALLVYLLAVGKTLALWQENGALHTQLAQAEQAPDQIRDIKNKLATFNDRLGVYLIEENDNQEKIVRIANEFCQKNRLILREVPALIVEDQNDFQVISTQIVAQGMFADLLKMVYYFEQQHKIGRVTSVKFEKAEDFKTRKVYLSVRILLQNIKINKK